jgi:cytochrome c553
MKINLLLQPICRAALAGVLLAPLVGAQQHDHAPAVVVRYCSGCHGVDGKSQLPYVPRLAGLNAGYMQQKLRSFRTVASGSVDEAFDRFARSKAAGNNGFSVEANTNMIGSAHALSEQDSRAAVEWYAGQQPASNRGGRPKLVAAGRAIFVNGSKGVPACQGCHGADAQGSDKAPRLAGQNAAYVMSQLDVFRSGGRKSTMTEVARSLETEQMRALATYLQSH